MAKPARPWVVAQVTTSTSWPILMALLIGSGVVLQSPGAVSAANPYSLPSSADDIIQPAVSWLLSQRNPTDLDTNGASAPASTSAGSSSSADGWMMQPRGWRGTELPRALLALLRLAEGARMGMEQNKAMNDADSIIQKMIRQWNSNDWIQSRQGLDIQLLLFLLKSQGCSGTSSGSISSRQEVANSLAIYALTLAAMCRNPRDFYQHDIIGPIMNLEREREAAEEDEDEVEKRSRQPFTFAFNVLAVCAGGGHLKRRHVVRLLEMASNQQSPDGMTHSIDVQAMVAMAIRCLSQSPSGSSLSSSKQRRLGDYLEQPLRLIAAQQDPDGSFDHNLATTALAIQALTMITSLNQSNPTGMDSIPWRLDSALDWIRSMQRSDGSFAGDIFTTTEVLLALSGRGYGTLGGRCTPPPLFPIEKPRSTVSPPVIGTTSIPSAGPRSDESTTDLIHFTYVVWIGQNRSEVNAIRLSIPVNTTFYEAMKTAAEADSRFEFSATVWPNGHYVHTIAGHRDQSIGFHFWLLFRTPFMPDPLNPPPTTYVAPAGVDDLYPQEGEVYLFWYKDV